MIRVRTRPIVIEGYRVFGFRYYLNGERGWISAFVQRAADLGGKVAWLRFLQVSEDARPHGRLFYVSGYATLREAVAA